jgi:hypothetical protein
MSAYAAQNHYQISGSTTVYRWLAKKESILGPNFVPSTDSMKKNTQQDQEEAIASLKAELAASDRLLQTRSRRRGGNHQSGGGIVPRKSQCGRRRRPYHTAQAAIGCRRATWLHEHTDANRLCALQNGNDRGKITAKRTGAAYIVGASLSKRLAANLMASFGQSSTGNATVTMTSPQIKRQPHHISKAVFIMQW